MPLVQAQESFATCQGLEADALRGELNRLNQTLLERDLQVLDIDYLVRLQWQSKHIDAIIDSQVLLASEQVRRETSGWRRFQSNWRPGVAQELAEQVARRAYTSELFRQAMDNLAHALAEGVAQQFQVTANRSATSSLQCLRAFIAGAYDESVVEVFDQQLRQEVQRITMAEQDIHVSTSPFGMTSAAGLATIIASMVARRVIQRIATRMSQRIAGNIALRVVGRAGAWLVPFVGWAVGLGLIAWDVVDGSMYGAFPAIEAQLRSDTVKAQVRREIADVIRLELPAMRAELAQELADSLYAQWRSFEDSFTRVLELSDNNPAFAEFFAALPSEEHHTLAELMALSDERQILAALEAGQLSRVLELQEAALPMLADVGSIALLLEWEEIAGQHLADVVHFAVYRHKSPQDFQDNTVLERLIRLDNRSSIAKLAPLDIAVLEQLQRFSLASLNTLASVLSSQELNHLAWFVERLEPSALNALMHAWLEDSTKVSVFIAADEAILASRDPREAILFLASPTSLASLFADVYATLWGRLSAQLLIAKYSDQNVATALSLLLLLLALLGNLPRLCWSLWALPPKFGSRATIGLGRRGNTIGKSSG